MGRARIVADLGGGEYTVEIEHDTTTADAMVARIDAMIAQVEEQLASAPASSISFLQFRIMTLRKRRAQVVEARDQDYQVDLWCADLSPGLSGTVGVIEVGTDREQGMNIRPGQPPVDADASFSLARDGQNTPFLTMHTADAILNFMLMPAIQKYRPTYRYGVISDLDVESNSCTVTLTDSFNDKFSQGIDLNLAVSYDQVPFEYMTCNAGAFTDGDAVVVEFKDYLGEGDGNPDPKVIGFKDNPKPCGGLYLVFRVTPYIEDVAQWVIWDVENDDWPDDPLLEGVSWPAAYTDVELFLDRLNPLNMVEPVEPDDPPQEVKTIWGPVWYQGEEMSDNRMKQPQPEDCWTGYICNVSSDYDRLGSYQMTYWRSETCYPMPEECEYILGYPPFDLVWTKYWPAVDDEAEAVAGYGDEHYDRRSYYLYNRMATGPQEVECRLEYEEEYTGERRIDMDGLMYCQESADVLTEGYYRRHTPLGIMEQLGHFLDQYSNPFHPEIHPLTYEFKELEWYDFALRSYYTDRSLCQVYVQQMILRWKESSGDGQYPSTSTEIRDEFYLDVKCYAGVDYHETGTDDVSPADQSRNTGFEAAIETAFQNVFSYQTFDPNYVYEWIRRLTLWSVQYMR